MGRSIDRGKRNMLGVMVDEVDYEGALARRLWRRYLWQNPASLVLLALQRVRLWRPETMGIPPRESLRYG